MKNDMQKRDFVRVYVFVSGYEHLYLLDDSTTSLFINLNFDQLLSGSVFV